MSKHVLPNLIALCICGAAMLSPEPYSALLLSVGLFALSGALTNWLAVHMLFNRVPGLYGSGVIVVRFEDFKKSILTLVHEHLFTRDRVDGALTNSSLADIDLEPMFAKLDLDAAA